RRRRGCRHRCGHVGRPQQCVRRGAPSGPSRRNQQADGLLLFRQCRDRRAFENVILPQLRKFSPELIIVSAGFDAHYRDPLASLNLKSEDFGWVTRKLMDVGDTSAEGRIVSVLEGGYYLKGLKEPVAAHVPALMGA